MVERVWRFDYTYFKDAVSDGTGSWTLLDLGFKVDGSDPLVLELLDPTRPTQSSQ
jgi:hypothetical protein